VWAGHPSALGIFSRLPASSPAFDAAENQRVLLGVEDGVELVARSGWRERDWHAQPAFGIKSDDHGWIIQPSNRAVNRAVNLRPPARVETGAEWGEMPRENAGIAKKGNAPEATNRRQRRFSRQLRFQFCSLLSVFLRILPHLHARIHPGRAVLLRRRRQSAPVQPSPLFGLPASRVRPLRPLLRILLCVFACI